VQKNASMAQTAAFRGSRNGNVEIYKFYLHPRVVLLMEPAGREKSYFRRRLGNSRSALEQQIGASCRKTGKLTERRMTANDVAKLIKRRAKVCGLPIGTRTRNFHGTDNTAYLENGGAIENAQHITAHESPRTTKLYDRTKDEITLDEIVRIAI
jgi:hypothetical protein